MANLKEETLDVLMINEKSPEDVIWCGDGKEFTFSFEKFLELADIEYDDGYGSQEVARDLFIVGDGWWLERGEYDGSEWWEYKELPQPKGDKIPTSLFGRFWNSLSNINKKEE